MSDVCSVCRAISLFFLFLFIYLVRSVSLNSFIFFFDLRHFLRNFSMFAIDPNIIKTI